MSTNSKKIRLDSLWVVVLILLVLLFASIALLFTVIKDFAGGDKNVIAIYPGDIFDKNGYITETVEAEKYPNIVVSDDRLSWDIDSNVDLFKNTYTNADGEVVVESNNGDKVIAPGTSNNYIFKIKNTGNVSLDYTMTLNSVFTLSDYDLPFYVRILSDDNYVMGTEDEWVKAKDAKDVTVKETLLTGKHITYTLEWMWPFEGENEILDDLNDTLIGNESANSNVNFELKIQTTTTITPGAVATDPSGNQIFDEIITRLGVEYIGIPLLIIIGLAPILLLLIILRGRVYLTGIVPECDKVFINGKEVVRSGNRFILEKSLLGKKRLELIVNDEVKYEIIFTIRRKKVELLKIEDNIIYIGYGIKGLELVFEIKDDNLVINALKSSSIDELNNIKTTLLVVPVKENGTNITINGLFIDQEGKYHTNEE